MSIRDHILAVAGRVDLEAINDNASCFGGEALGGGVREQLILCCRVGGRGFEFLAVIEPSRRNADSAFHELSSEIRVKSIFDVHVFR
ncbi:hypothetical protein Agau_C200506 [Agrobacterium tumefaciens F2]|nr:hypothetical protein Agau_C200506 [Agrobacterium tumefaciens F2]